MKELLKAYRERVQALNGSIDQGIEAHRKADGLIRVQDREGRPVAGAKITLHQCTHDFGFGCNGLRLGQMGEMNDLYEREFLKLFNLVTTTACWSVTEMREGFFRFTEADGDRPRRPPLDRIVDFGKKHGLRVKCQPLMADSWWPDWASREPRELMAQWTRFITAVAARYASQVDVWDVVNEAMLCKGRTPQFPLLNDSLDYVDGCFEAAGKVFPEQRGVFELNEASNVNYIPQEMATYFSLAQRLISKGLPVESIGFQFHMFSGESGIRHLENVMFPLETIQQTYRRFGQLGRPLSITEITVPSRLPGVSAEEGEAIQAEILHNLYRLWFAQPEIHSIIYWNFMDGTHWKNEGDCLGCLIDVNLNEKPSYQALYQLINRQWKTHEVLETNERGEAALRGFKGEYELRVDCQQGCRTLSYGLHAQATNALTVTL